MDIMTAPVNQSPEARENRKGTVRIVIADDHPIVREGYKRLIEGEDGLEVCGEAEDMPKADREYFDEKIHPLLDGPNVEYIGEVRVKTDLQLEAHRARCMVG